MGFGLFGKRSTGPWTIGYEAYLTNGFDGSIISNAEDRTFLPATKASSERFTESTNGMPLATVKAAIRHQRFGEIGFSTMGGVYNQFEVDGLVLDRRRRVDVFAIDMNTGIKPWGTDIKAEWAWVLVDVPATYTQQYGSLQCGGYVDMVQPIRKGDILGFMEGVLNVAVRVEYVDWNAGTFRETGTRIGDEAWAITPSVSFRPVAGTVVRLNYLHQRTVDLLGNAPSLMGGFQFGIASYF